MVLATLVYLKKNKKTLMICPKDKIDPQYNGKWNGLGGKIQDGETPEECARREVLEESGLKVNNLNIAGILTFPKITNNEGWYCIVYTSNDFSGVLVESSEGKLRWVNDNEILKLNLWEGDKYFLPLISNNRFFSGRFYYRDGKLEKHDITYPVIINNI